MLYFSKNNKNAFTLVELMVIIVLIIIIILWIKSINFNKLSNEQKSEIFANKIISLIEEVRDDSLTWKWQFDSNLNTWFKKVEKRIIEIKKFWENFEIILKNDWIEAKKITKKEKEKIESLKCWKNNFSWNPTITFSSDKISLNWCNDKFYISVSFNNEKNEIIFDTISWLVKKCKNSCN